MDEEESAKNSISEIEKILNASSHQYLTIQAGDKSILQFLPHKGIDEVEKTYNGQNLRRFALL